MVFDMELEQEFMQAKLKDSETIFLEIKQSFDIGND
jgi:hypothetical protein